jgi:hypothetical protein
VPPPESIVPPPESIVPPPESIVPPPASIIGIPVKHAVSASVCVLQLAGGGVVLTLVIMVVGSQLGALEAPVHVWSAWSCARHMLHSMFACMVVAGSFGHAFEPTAGHVKPPPPPVLLFEHAPIEPPINNALIPIAKMFLKSMKNLPV